MTQRNVYGELARPCGRLGPTPSLTTACGDTKKATQIAQSARLELLAKIGELCHSVVVILALVIAFPAFTSLLTAVDRVSDL